MPTSEERADTEQKAHRERPSAKIPAINQGANFPSDVGRLYSRRRIGQSEAQHGRHSFLHRTLQSAAMMKPNAAGRTRGFWHFTKCLPENFKKTCKT